MKKIAICFIAIFYSSLLLAIDFNEAKKLLRKNNPILQVLSNKIDISKQDETLKAKWQNPAIILGANDLLINDFANRDKEAMQTQFVTISQNIPIGSNKGISVQIAKKDTQLNKYALKYEILKLNSILLYYFYKIAIINKKLKLIHRYKKNIKEIRSTLLQQIKRNTNQIETINSDIKIAMLDIKIQNLKFLRATTILNIKELLNKQDIQIQAQLDSLELTYIDSDNILNTHPYILYFKEQIQKSKQNIKLQQSNRFKDVKLSVGYYQREQFDDYMAFNVAIALPIYNTESKKINKSKIQYLKQKNKLKDVKNKFILQINTLKLTEKTALANYKILNNKIIKLKKQIGKVLNSYSSIKSLSATKVIDNLNDIIEQELIALNELDKFYEAKARLVYFTQGK